MAATGNLKFLFAILFAGFVAADSGDDFSNNLFSDLAPILALFGERVTMQFMSQSMGWADNVVLAMAPLGIITVIVSAIRVGGPSWLKAVIGRARENLAVVEADLMSSTSEEVCELWNGQKVVRCMGSAPVSEFICLLPEDSPKDTTENTPQNMLENMTENMPEGTAKNVSKGIPSGENGSKACSKTCPKIVTIDLKAAVAKGYLGVTPSNPDGSRATFPADCASKDSSSESRAEEGQGSSSRPSSEIIIVRNVDADAPNILLNSHDQFGRGEVRLVAVVGTVIQLGVLTYSGFATYYHTLKFPKDEQPVAGYAFPCTAAGTLILVVGMLLCAYVVDSSTKEDRYRPREGRKARLVWLQQEKTVSDQVFKSFAVMATNERKVITTSRRGDKKSLKLTTMLGTMVSLCGFVLQFIGLRGMHWSASVTQLGAVIVMTILRVWVRRGLAKPPLCEPLTLGFELDWFAMRLGDNKNPPWQHASPAMDGWSIESPGTHEGLLQSSRETPSNAHRIMKIRLDLGRLAGWRGPASAEAVSVARAIEVTMDALFKPQRGAVTEFTWSLITRDKQPVDFRLKVQDGKWKACIDKMEAALSLWLFSVYRDRHGEKEHGAKPPSSTRSSRDDEWLRGKGSPPKRSLRLLGSYTRGLHRDLCWWMPSEAIRIMTVVEEDKGGREEVDSSRLEIKSHRIVGRGPERRLESQWSVGQTRYRTRELMKPNFGSADKGVSDGDTAGSLLATAQYGSLKLLYAQDMFSAFMWAAVKSLAGPIEGDVEIRPGDVSGVDGWQSFTLRNDHLSRMAQDIHDTGLGSLDDIYLSIIPPLSAQEKLPHPGAIVELGRQHAKQHEQLQHWEQAGDSYLWLFRTASTFPKQSHIATKATAVLMEYLRTTTLACEQRKDQRYEERDIKRLERLKSTLEEELKSVDRGTLSSLMTLYEEQGRAWKCVLVQEAQCDRMEDASDPKPVLDRFNRTNLHHLAQFDHVWAIREELEKASRTGANPEDIHHWTPLHYASAKGSTNAVEILLKRQAKANTRDLLEWTPLHYACQRGETSIVQNLVRAGAELDVRGRDGVAPLHCAAMNGHLDVVRSLIEAGAALDVLDASRNTPLHWAAFNGHQGVVEYLRKDANERLRDHNGRTALHLAAISKNADEEAEKDRQEVVRALAVNKEATQAKDRVGKTPLHYAATSGLKAVAKLLVDLGAEKESEDHAKKRPLHRAAESGQEAVVRLLIEMGADKEAKDHRRRRPLHLAAVAGQEAVVRLLVEMGADKEAKDGIERTPLHLATETGQEVVVRLLVEMGADKEAKDGIERTPLHLATETGQEVVVRLLVEMGADKEAKDYIGKRPLHYAVTTGHEVVVRLLVEMGADKEAKDHIERTPLHLAAETGQEVVVRLLVEMGADKEAKDGVERTPLHLAALTAQEAVVRLLVEMGADKEAKDRMERMPLHLAAGTGQEAVIRLLAVEQGANKEAEDINGQTLLQLAANGGHEAITRLLQ